MISPTKINGRKQDAPPAEPTGPGTITPKGALRFATCLGLDANDNTVPGPCDPTAAYLEAFARTGSIELAETAARAAVRKDKP